MDGVPSLCAHLTEGRGQSLGLLFGQRSVLCHCCCIGPVGGDDPGPYPVGGIVQTAMAAPPPVPSSS